MGVDVMKGQLCVNQGAFRTSGVGVAYGLEYIAANLSRPTTVLHWPSTRELARELARGDTTDVGVTFTFQLLPRLWETVALIRRLAPRARVILGGYGTAAPESHAWGDEVCDGEGIAFCRALFREREGEPVEHPTLVYGNRLFSLPIQAGRKVMVCTGLGCANGCDFCATSARFRRTYVPFVQDGDHLFRVMDDLSRRTGLDEFQVFDENFLADEARARRLADLCDAHGRHFDFFTFSSMAALSRYSAADLCRIGVSAVWVGLEGKKAGYEKLDGERIRDLCARLRSHGILVVGSMIVGFDYQTRDTVQAELDEILEAAPTYLQCLLYGPTPGTPLWERMDREGRWRGGPPGRGGVPYGRCDGFEPGFHHPHLTPDDLRDLQRSCYDQDLRRHGPSIYRAIATWMDGWLHLRDASEAFLRARAAVYRRKLLASRPLLAVGIAHAPSPEVRDRLTDLRARLLRELPGPGLRERVVERAILPAAVRYTEATIRADLWQEPSLVRTRYRETA